MSKKISEMPEKLSMVDGDHFTIVDSEDAAPVTQNKKVLKSTALAGLQPTAPAGNQLGVSGGWTAAGDSATRNVGTGSGDVASGDAPSTKVGEHESAYAHANLPTTAEKAAMTNANAPSGVNPFLTQADGGGGSSTFTGLTDTPANYTGAGDQYVKVKATEDGLEFTPGTGGAYLPLAGGVMSGDIQVDDDWALRPETPANSVILGLYGNSTTSNGASVTVASPGVGGTAGRVAIIGGTDTGPNTGDVIIAANLVTLCATFTDTEITLSLPTLVPDEAYGAGWDGDLSVPTKNAIYDKIESLPGGGGWVDGSEVLHWIDSVNDLGSVGTNQTAPVTNGHMVAASLTGSISINFTGTIAAGDSRNFACYISTGGFTPTFQWNGVNLTVDMDWWDISADATYMVTFFANSAGCQITGLAKLGVAV